MIHPPTRYHPLVEGILHRNSLDVQVNSTEHAPIWKSVEPTMSTSPLASQQIQPATENAHTSTIEPELLSLPMDSILDNVPARDRDLEPTMPMLKQEQRSWSRSVARDGGNVRDNDSSEFNSLGGVGDYNVAKRQKRDSGMVSGTIRSRKKQQKTRKKDVHDESSDVDEDLASWKPSRTSRAQQVPCHSRATRRQGDSVLVEGLKKRKRPRKGMKVEPGSATERSTLSESKRDQADSQPMDSVEPHKESSFLVGLTRTDTALSESQRLEYEQVSVGMTSLECSHLPADEATVTADDVVELVLEQPGEADTIVFRDSHDHRASQPSATERQVLEISQESGVEDSKESEAIEVEEKPNDQKEKQMVSSFQDHQPSTVEFTLLETKTIAGERGRLKTLATDDESQADGGPKRSRMTSAKGGSRRPKGRKRKAAVTPRLEDADDDDAANAEAMTREVGLPPELYKPRPTRSRAKRDTNPAGDDGGIKTISSTETAAVGIGEVEASNYVAEPDKTSKRGTRRPIARYTKEHAILVPTEAVLTMTKDDEYNIGRPLSRSATPGAKTRKGRISEARTKAGLDTEKQTIELDSNGKENDDDLPSRRSRIRSLSRKTNRQADIPMAGTMVDVAAALLSPTKTPSPKYHTDNDGQDKDDDEDNDDDEPQAVSHLSTSNGRTKSIHKKHAPPRRGLDINENNDDDVVIIATSATDQDKHEGLQQKGVVASKGNGSIKNTSPPVTIITHTTSNNGDINGYDHNQDQDVHVEEENKRRQETKMKKAVITPPSPRPAYRVGLSRKTKIQPLLSCLLKR